MAIELVEKYLPYVDEQFTAESKKEVLTNRDFSFVGANTVKIYKISTGKMNDYGRRQAVAAGSSRYGTVESLDATTQAMTMTKDRSFTFAIDALDADETGDCLEAASALARQIREVVIPEVDTHVLGKMCKDAGNKPPILQLTKDNIYTEIIKASAVLDDKLVPETNRKLVVTPDVYLLMKQCKDIVMETDIGEDMRIRGVIANLDGMAVMKVPASRLPDDFGFLIAHPCATVAPTKLESYKTHDNPPGISGWLVEGRIVYDAFVMDNKKMALYYQAQPGADEAGNEETADPDETA